MVTIIPGSIGGVIVNVPTLQLAIRTISASTTLLTTDYKVLVNASLGPVTVSLPTSASQFDGASGTGRLYNIKKIDPSANTVTIQPQPGEKIDELTNLVINAQDVDYTLQTDGTQWWRI